MGMSDLHFKKLGSGHPLIILHGLYGSGSNWLSIAKKLAGICEVFLVDQRNHGRSPHHSEHNYLALMEDLRQFMDDHGLQKSMLLGHSMGGKTAMYMATHYPGRVSRLIVADMSPLSYVSKGERAVHFAGHEYIMNALLSLDLQDIESLRDASIKLEEAFPDIGLRQFLLKNLHKNDAGLYEWQLNLEVLLKNLDSLGDGLDPDQYPSEGFRQYPALFIRGENSAYISDRDVKAIKRLFPASNLVSILGAGHWLHAEQPEIFVKIVKKFLLEY